MSTPNWLSRAALPLRMFAIGDIHGCVEHLDILLERIFTLMHTNPMDDQLIFLGDYVDRGAASYEVISRLLDLEQSGLPIVFLKGNHEDMMFSYLVEGHVEQGMNWLANGGGATLKSYGIDISVDYYNPKEVERVRNYILKIIPPNHLEFLSRLTLSHEAEGYLFVHAGVRAGISISNQTSEDIMWIRHPFLNSKEAFGAIVVHGHTPGREPKILSNRIAIDTGAYMGGYLTAAVITNKNTTFLTSKFE